MATTQGEEGKDKFFQHLYHLDCLDSDVDGEFNSIFAVETPRIPHIASRPATHTPASTLPEQPTSTIFNRISHNKHQGATIRSLDSPLLNPTKVSKNARLVSETRQIFKHCTFYFIPNNNIAVPRRKRIEKALQYGAVWTRAWTTDITHVIVDRNITMKDVLKALALGAEPVGPAFVNDVWLTECIGAGGLRDTTRKRFQVVGGLVLDQGARKTFAEDQREKGSVSPLKNAQEACGKHIQYETNQNVVRRSEDALDEIIIEIKGTSHLPIDSEESFTPSPGTWDSEQEFKSSRVAAWNEAGGKGSSGFTCMEKHDGVSKFSDPNARTIEILQQMASYYDRIGDSWRWLAYRKGVAALRRQDKLISTREEALQLPQIGKRLAAKIDEIVMTDRLRSLDCRNKDDQALQLFMGIYQVGYPTACKWISQGHRTLEDLETKAELTPNQRVGVEHYHDFQQRIPRQEVILHGEIVRRALQAADPKLQMIMGGSFRRGNMTSGDIDLIVTMEDSSMEHIRILTLGTVIPNLLQDGFLKIDLAVASLKDQGSKWHGASALPGSSTWRRIDFLFVPWDQLGAALIYFTGNDIFNRSIRLLASRKGMRLNQHGLYCNVLRGHKRERMTDGELIEGRSEERIFEILGVPWRPPEHRICG